MHFRVRDGEAMGSATWRRGVGRAHRDGRRVRLDLQGRVTCPAQELRSGTPHVPETFFRRRAVVSIPGGRRILFPGALTERRPDGPLELRGCGVNRFREGQGLMADDDGVERTGIRLEPAAQITMTRLPAIELAQVDIDSGDPPQKAVQRAFDHTLDSSYQLFTAVNVARWAGVEPEEALRKMLNRFTERFSNMEAHAGSTLDDLSPEAWDHLWRAAKAAENERGRL